MTERHWWQDGIIYQIYPRSFQDGDGDGIGDLPGITARLDYVAGLGVRAIWISPIYPSPMADFGYDVSDYTGIDPMFGTLEEFDTLITAAHKRELKVILDFVPAHSSDLHPWFVESRSSKDNPKRDWYLWHDPASGGGPPNNWRSRFGGSAWELDEVTGQYYCHTFLKQQPDLNWRNPELRTAMYEALRFWMRRGVDGFRIDVLWVMIKDNLFRDNPVNPDWRPGQNSHWQVLPVYTSDRPEMAQVTQEMRSVLDEFPRRVMIGEIYLPLERLVTYYGPDLKGAQLPFNFALIDAQWDAVTIADLIVKYESLLPVGAWPNWVLGNHDKSRVASRVGAAQARVAAMLLLTLRGTPTMYYDDEIGMSDVSIAPELVQDPVGKNGIDGKQGRDPERTPMQWDASANGGFTRGNPWLPMAGDFATTNIALQQSNPESLLRLYKNLIALRYGSTALREGRIENVRTYGDGNVLGYHRVALGQRVSVILNMSDQPRHVPEASGATVLATSPGLLLREDRILPANTGFVLSL